MAKKSKTDLLYRAQTIGNIEPIEYMIPYPNTQSLIEGQRVVEQLHGLVGSLAEGAAPELGRFLALARHGAAGEPCSRAGEGAHRWRAACLQSVAALSSARCATLSL